MHALQDIHFRRHNLSVGEHCILILRMCTAEFSIDEQTGVIRATKPLDREQRNLFMIRVRATQLAQPVNQRRFVRQVNPPTRLVGLTGNFQHCQH